MEVLVRQQRLNLRGYGKETSGASFSQQGHGLGAILGPQVRALCRRLLAHPSVPGDVKDLLRSERQRLDPLELLQRIWDGQAALAALASGDLSHGPERQSLDQFLANLLNLWQEGDARPTHRAGPAQPRWWRTHPDLFEGLWPEILLWLQEVGGGNADSADVHDGGSVVSPRGVG